MVAEPETPHHFSDGGGEKRRKRKRSTIFIKETRKGHCHSRDQHQKCFKDYREEAPEPHDGSHTGFPERIDSGLLLSHYQRN